MIRNVRGENDCFILRGLGDPTQDIFLCGTVETRQGFIHQVHPRRFPEKTSRQDHDFLLSLGQIPSINPAGAIEHRIDGIRGSPLKVLQQTEPGKSVTHLPTSQVLVAKHDILVNGFFKEHGVLVEERYDSAQGRDIVRVDRSIAKDNRPCGWREKSHNQFEEGGFSATRGSYEHPLGPWGYDPIQIVEDPGGGWRIPERDVPEFQGGIVDNEAILGGVMDRGIIAMVHHL